MNGSIIGSSFGEYYLQRRRITVYLQTIQQQLAAEAAQRERSQLLLMSLLVCWEHAMCEHRFYYYFIRLCLPAMGVSTIVQYTHALIHRRNMCDVSVRQCCKSTTHKYLHFVVVPCVHVIRRHRQAKHFAAPYREIQFKLD